MDQRNVAVAREALDAFARRDLGVLSRHLADDVAWHTPGASLISGDYHGRDAVVRYLERVLDLTAGTQRVEPVDLRVRREHVAAVVDVSAERHGRILRDRAIQLLAFENDRIVMRRVYPEDQAAFDRFWSD